MARRVRLEFPGAIYHISNHGNRRDPIFDDDSDRETLIRTLGETCGKTGWVVHAFCLMPEHFHLVVRTPHPNLVLGMKWFLGTYTRRFNLRHSLSGHLFAGRYRAQFVDPSGLFSQRICDYVHLNPVRRSLLAEATPLRDYPWSSLPLFLKGEQSPSWLRPAVPQAPRRARNGASARVLEIHLENLRKAGLSSGDVSLRQAWCFGSADFSRRIAGQLRGRVGRHHYGPEVQAAAEAQAEKIIELELRQRKWSEDQLRLGKKGAVEKLRIAQRLRDESTMTLRWIASRLSMGTHTYLAHLLYWKGREDRESAPATSSQPGQRKRPLSGSESGTVD